MEDETNNFTIEGFLKRAKETESVKRKLTAFSDLNFHPQASGNNLRRPSYFLKRLGKSGGPEMDVIFKRFFLL